MKGIWRLTLLAAIVAFPTFCRSDDFGDAIRKAVQRSTLDQPGTRPFHLKAVIAPSFERDKECGRTGEVEIWWASPTHWKREVRSPGFHQIAIVSGDGHWQKSEGSYFPEWLQETATELIRPIPPVNDVLLHADAADVKRIGPMTNLTWETRSGTREVPNILRSWVAIDNTTGLFLYAGGIGWGGEFTDYADFHGRTIARTVKVGSPQVTAKVTTLEEFPAEAQAVFDVTASSGDSQLLQTIVIDETTLRKNLLSGEPVSWPPIQDGPIEGHVTTELVVDRNGRVRDIGTMISDNPGLNEAARNTFAGMLFAPFLSDGSPVQVISQITVTFKAVRPAGTESFESARFYFERGRRMGFPLSQPASPYILRATFQARTRAGDVESGQYVDTWQSANEWRREASIGKSRYVRSQQGEKRYESFEGADTQLLRLVFHAIEPIPAIDTFVESDWRIRRDTSGEARTIRVVTGYEAPNGEPDPEHTRAYWFDDSGKLVKAYFQGMEIRRANFRDFQGAAIPEDIRVVFDGKVGMLIHLNEIAPAPAQPSDAFTLRGHEWHRAFTDEAR